MVEADHLYGTDARWWAHHIGDITRDFGGKCWTQSIQWDQHDPAAWGITCLQGDQGKPGLSTDPNVIHCGMNSGYAAINLAYHLGAETILLLGFDMQMDGDKRHWFGAHPENMEVASNYQNFIERFKTIDPAKYGIEIVNVTRQTALEHFPRMTLEEAHDLWHSVTADRNICTG